MALAMARRLPSWFKTFLKYGSFATAGLGLAGAGTALIHELAKGKLEEGQDSISGTGSYKYNRDRDGHADMLGQRYGGLHTTGQYIKGQGGYYSANLAARRARKAMHAKHGTGSWNPAYYKGTTILQGNNTNVQTLTV